MTSRRLMAFSSGFRGSDASPFSQLGRFYWHLIKEMCMRSICHRHEKNLNYFLIPRCRAGTNREPKRESIHSPGRSSRQQAVPFCFRLVRETRNKWFVICCFIDDCKARSSFSRVSVDSRQRDNDGGGETMALFLCKSCTCYESKTIGSLPSLVQAIFFIASPVSMVSMRILDRPQ